MHSHHAQVQRMRSRNPAQSQQRDSSRNIEMLDELANLLCRTGKNNAVSGKNNGALRGADQFNRLVVIAYARRKIGTVARKLRRRTLPVKNTGTLLGILGDVNQYRSRTPRLRDVKCLAHRTHNIFSPGYQIVVLGDG